MLRLVVIGLCFVACAPPSSEPIAKGAIRALLDAPPIDVTQPPYNATPAKDGQDDRVAIQAAIDAACLLAPPRIYFPAGDYEVGRPPAGVVDSLRVTCDNLEFYGDGQGATTIAMTGSGMLPAFPNEPGAWKLLHVTGGAANVHVHDLALEGGQGRTVDTEEQTHLFEAGESENLLVENVIAALPQPVMPAGAVPCQDAPNGVFCERPNHGDHTPILCHSWTDPGPPPVTHVGLKGAICTVEPDGMGGQTWILAGWYRGGDCFRFFSEPNIPVKDAVVRNVTGTDCDRASFSGQRGIDGLTITDSAGRTDNDTPFDLEATGGGGLKRLVVAGVTLSRGTSGGGGYSLSITGNGDTGLTDAVFDCLGGKIPDGGVGILDVDRVELKNCEVNSGLLSQLSTFDVRKRARSVTVRNSKIVRPAGAPPLPVVTVRHHTGVAPRLLTLVDTVLEQHTIAPIIDLQSLHALQLYRVTMVYAAAPWLPPTNANETAFIIADTVPGAPQRVDSVVMNDVKVLAPDDSVAAFIRLGAAPAFPQTRKLVLTNVNVVGLRTALVRLNGAAPAGIALSSVVHDAPAACQAGAGATCPPL